MYTAYFGLREKPFNVTPDPRFFYTNPIYQEAYASLLYGIRERKGFLLLTGEVGTGKTTLLYRLMRDLGEKVHFAFFYNTTLTFEELLSHVCADFGLSVEGKSRLQKIQALNEFLLTRLKEGGTGALLIDEAQDLGDEALENLRLLSNLETPREKLLQIVLVGQPELELKLAQLKLRQLKQRMAIQSKLDCLKEREVGPFIYHRLQIAGCERWDLFPPETIGRIAAYSKGIPRLINIICDNALAIAYSLAHKTVSVGIIEEVARDLQLEANLEGTRVDATGGITAPSAPLSLESLLTRTYKADATGGITAPSTAEEEPTSKPERLPSTIAVWSKPRGSSRLVQAGMGTFLGFLLLGGVMWTELPESFTNLEAWFAPFITEKSELKQAQGSPRSELLPELVPLSHGQRPAQPDEKPLAVDKQTELGPPPSLHKHENSGKQKSPLPMDVEETAATLAEAPNRLLDSSQIPSPASEWQDRPIVVQPGTTVYSIVLKVYGNYSALALDLIKEFNPHIKDLDWVIAGEHLWLPPHIRETLLRKQPDGSYRLILASFRDRLRAQEFSQVVHSKGYETEITPRRVSGNLMLYRVEIAELNNPEAANQAWDFARIMNSPE